VTEVLWVLLGFNIVYAIVATPAGALADRVSRRGIVAASWMLYALSYLGFAVARGGRDIVMLYLLYGVYHGLAAGAAKALVADLVPTHLRGVAYGGYAAATGVVALPASLLGGLLWEGFGSWSGYGPAAPFLFGALTAAAAAAMLVALVPPTRPEEAGGVA
jgi:MFS family permease